MPPIVVKEERIMPYGFRIERDTPLAAQKIYDRLADAAAWGSMGANG